MAKKMTQIAKDKWLAGKAASVEAISKKIIDQFQSGDISKALANIFIHRNDDIPCRKWSWSNQFLTALAGHDDARTFKQWLTVGRCVRKGEKGFDILQPNRFKAKKDGQPVVDKAGNEKWIVKGFNASKRFGLSQTDVVNAELWTKHSEKDAEAEQFLAELPLREVADTWGLNITSYSGKNGKYAGWYRRGETIAIGVENLSTWAHELTHAADDKLGNLIERGQHYRSETVAELGGAILLYAAGYDRDADLGGCWQYISDYAKHSGKEPIACCMEVLKRTEQAVKLILDTADQIHVGEELAVA